MSLKELIREFQDKPLVAVQGIVEVVNLDELTVDVKPAGELIRNIPLRIMRYTDTIGSTMIPALKTECIVLFLNTGNPTILECQKWDKILFHDADGLGMSITAQDRVELGLTGSATHPVGWGDAIAALFDSWVAWADTHIHLEHDAFPTGFPTTSAPTTTEIESEETFTS